MALSRHNLDLHALECFDMLMRERSVSRAAERLGLSQSSTSEVLSRLRERFGDPLLVRGREGMQPTPQAEALLPEVRAALDRLRLLLERAEAFEPGRSTQRFRITASDYTQLLLMPALCRELALQAPRTAIDVVPVHLLRAEQALETGELDVAIAFHPEPPGSLRRAPLFTDDYVCITRQGHPCTAQPLDPAAYAALAHVSVAPSGLGYFASAVDTALEAAGLSRRVAVSSPHFLLAAHLVAHGDMVLTLPRQAATALADFLPLTVVEIPLPLRRVDVAMYWHERTHHSAPHRWLRERIREVLAPGGAAA